MVAEQDLPARLPASSPARATGLRERSRFRSARLPVWLGSGSSASYAVRGQGGGACSPLAQRAKWLLLAGVEWHRQAAPGEEFLKRKPAETAVTRVRGMGSLSLEQPKAD